MEDNKIRTYSVEEVAEILKVTPKSVYPYLRSGELRGKRIGRRWIITEPALREFLDYNAEETEEAEE